jgi:fibronectin type 3 domain-containing protein
MKYMKKILVMLLAAAMLATFSVSVALAIGAPAGVSASATGSSTVKVSWKALPDAAQYTLYVGASASSMNELTTVGNSALSYTVQHLNANTKYYFSVQASPVSGQAGPISAAVSAKTKAGIAAPTKLKASSLSASQIKMTWKKRSGAKSYTVYYSTSSSGFSYLDSVKGVSYTVKNLSPDTVYYFEVRSVNSKGEGNFTSAQSARTRTLPPASLIAVPSGSSAVIIAWTPVSGATSYALYRSATSTGTFTQITKFDSSSLPSYLNTGLAANTTYYYKVVAYNSAGASDYSSTASVTTLK